MQYYITKNEVDTKKLAKKFAATLNAGDVVVFKGNLGAGKTLMCREIIQYHCGVETNVSSPTFNLLQTYESKQFTIYHFDLYRLKHEDEIYELGFEDALNNSLCLIEWAEIIDKILPKQRIHITLERIDDDSRHITIERI